MASAETVQGPNTNIYKYTATMKYTLGDKVYDIETTNIRSIAIDSDYEKMNMPMIFITLGIYQSMANRMILNQNKGLFILDIKRCIYNSDMPDLYTNYISDKFTYFITGNLDDKASLELEEEDAGDDTIVTVGLLSLDHINKNKKSVNGVIDGKLGSVMYYLTSHLPVLIEPPDNNIFMHNKIIPPMNSVSKSLEFVNSINVFYDTPYRFFIDFNMAYLISSSGKAVKSKDEDIGTVMITIYNEDSRESKVQGMTTNNTQSLYELYINSKDCEFSDNNVHDKSFRKISATNSSGQKIDADLTAFNNNPNIISKTKSVRIMNDNNGLIDNMVAYMNNSSMQLLIQKTDIDTSVLTMNKEYIIRIDDVYNRDNYNGRYILTRKRELYIRESDTFTMNVMLLFKKII